MDHRTIYEIIGGDETLQHLVDEFYARVEADPTLRPMFPEDLEEGKRWQFLFLKQYFGGDPDYMAIRGHPRLRMRHSPFPIDQQARDAWLSHMIAAMETIGISDPAYSIMREYFERASEFMINR
ncbi:MAG: globin [Anaerolineae bacterium]|jgi:hemoglobin|nr:globin [Anaerolineae bacterium]